MPYLSFYASPMGDIALFSDGDALTGLLFPTQLPQDFNPFLFTQKDDLHIFIITKTFLEKYFNGKKDLVIPPLHFSGTPFQELVWQELLKIPYGELLTYGELGNRVKKVRGTTFMSARAIGHAVGLNPISLIIPCHRVIGAKGKLTGYGGGLPLKKALLKIEGHDLKTFKD